MSQSFAQRIQMWGRTNRRVGPVVITSLTAEMKPILGGTGYIGISADVIEQTLESGIGPTGAFFTFLPVAYASEMAAREGASEQYGDNARVVALDTSMVPDFSKWQRNGQSLESMLVWGVVPAEAISEVRPANAPRGPAL